MCRRYPNYPYNNRVNYYNRGYYPYNNYYGYRNRSGLYFAEGLLLGTLFFI